MPDRKTCLRCGAFLEIGDYDICEPCEDYYAHTAPTHPTNNQPTNPRSNQQ